MAKQHAWIEYIRFKNLSDYCKYKKLIDEVRNDTRLINKKEQNNITLLSKSNPTNSGATSKAWLKVMIKLVI